MLNAPLGINGLIKQSPEHFEEVVVPHDGRAGAGQANERSEGLFALLRRGGSVAEGALDHCHAGTVVVPCVR